MSRQVDTLKPVSFIWYFTNTIQSESLSTTVYKAETTKNM